MTVRTGMKAAASSLAVIVCCALCSELAASETYPTRPIRLVVSGSPGGGNDIAARLVSPGLSTTLGQQVVIDNRPGTVMTDIVVRAPADGYTLLLAASILWIAPFLEKVSYDPMRDLAPVSLLVRAPAVLAVHPSLPVKNVKELIALAKAKPGQLNYASSGAGGVMQLSAELFKSMAGVNIMEVPYKGGGDALNAVLGGEVQMLFATIGAVVPLEKSGKLRLLAITSAESSPLLPSMPTMAVSGLPGYESASIIGIFAPAKTSAALIRTLNEAIVTTLRNPDVKQKFTSAGIETVGSSPEQLASTVKAEMARMAKVFKNAGTAAK